jgi:Zn-dependent peptidase ImmA (M78 family)
MSERVKIQPELLQWAQERAELDTAELCSKFPKYKEWISGETSPTFKQLEEFAAHAYVPLGYLLLSEPPEETLSIPDFRTVTNRKVKRPSPHLLDTIHAAQLRQSWMREFLIERKEPPLKFIGSCNIGESPDVVATAIRRTLNLEPHWSRRLDSWEEALRILIQKTEEADVLVMINGVVENNTHRPLDVEEFRGFALVDTYAPLIFVNGSDAKAAQMFTLTHELAHLLLGQGGVSGFDDLHPSEHKVESFCNRVAAEFLVPELELREVWVELKGNADPFNRLARIFKVSPVVAARRALDLKLISRQRYFDFYNEYLKKAALQKARSKGGGNFYLTLGMRLGKRFPAAVYSAAKEGRLAFREAYQLTGLSGASYDRFGRELGFAI